MDRKFIEQWLNDLKNAWWNKDIEKAISLFKNTTYVANIASELYLNGYANKLIFSGGLGKITYKLWNETEAEKFAKIAIEKGVPSKDIYLEKESTNTGDNFRFSKRLIENLKLDIKDKFILKDKQDEGYKKNIEIKLNEVL